MFSNLGCYNVDCGPPRIPALAGFLFVFFAMFLSVRKSAGPN
jgi:hypothetical protein